jgi:hypothetical protein
MQDDKIKSGNDVRHDGARPSQTSTERSLSGVRPAPPELVKKGLRPAQEGHRPAQTDAQALGPVAQNPGSGVPKKPS